MPRCLISTLTIALSIAKDYSRTGGYTAAAVALTVGASGLVNLKTTVLMTPEEVDQATKKSPAYRAPGA